MRCGRLFHRTGPAAAKSSKSRRPGYEAWHINVKVGDLLLALMANYAAAHLLLFDLQFTSLWKSLITRFGERRHACLELNFLIYFICHVLISVFLTDVFIHVSDHHFHHRRYHPSHITHSLFYFGPRSKRVFKFGLLVSTAYANLSGSKANW